MTKQATNTVAELMKSPAGRRALSVKSPVFFDTYYCDMRFAKHREGWFDHFERSITKAKEGGMKGRLLLLAPRDHGKTEACVTLAVRALCLNRSCRILWICESQGQAEKRMRRVKTVLQSQKVVSDWCSEPEKGFGPWQVSSEDKWTSTQVYVNRPLQSVDPSLEAVGSGGAVTGGHFDLIVCDDLEDDKTTFSASVRAKTREWFQGTVGPMLVKTGCMVVVGTRKHHEDLYGHLLDDPTCRVIEDKAVKSWPKGHSFIYERDERGREIVTGVKVEGEADVLWPEERPIDYLLRERLSVGQRLFSREFQNEVQDDSAAAIKWDWLQTAKNLGSRMTLYEIPEGVQGLDVVQGWDLALVSDAKKAESRDTDYTVGITWGRDNDGNRYLLGIRRVRGVTPAQLRSVVISEYERFKALGHAPRVVSVERNNFGELHFMGLQRTTDLPLKPHLTTGKNKADPWDGVPSLGVLFENAKVRLPSKTADDHEAIDPLVQELWGLGREKHDDTVMALWIAEVQLRKAGFVHVVAFGDDDGRTLAAEADERMAPGDLLDDPDAVTPYNRKPGQKWSAPEAWGGLLGSFGITDDR